MRRKKDGLYMARVRVPADIVDAFGQKEVNRSLGTKDRREAERVKPEVVAKIHREFENFRLRTNPARLEQHPPPSVHEIERWVEHWRAAELTKSIRLPEDRDEADAYRRDLEIQLARLIEHRSAYTAKPVQHVASPADEPELLTADDEGEEPVEFQIERVADAILADNGFPAASPVRGAIDNVVTTRVAHIDKSDRVYANLFEKTRRAMIDVVNERVRAAGGDVNVIAVGANPLPNRNAAQRATLADLVRDFRADRVATNQSAKELSEYDALFPILSEVIGDTTPVEDVSTADCRRLRDLLLRLPYRARGRFPGKTYAEIVEIADAADDLRIKPQTVNKHLQKTVTLFNWAIQNELRTGANPASNLKIKGAGHTRDSRRPFSIEDLNRLFGAPLYRDTPPCDRGYKFWIPLVALFHGLRAGEAGQLYLDNVYQEEGVWVLDINDRRPDQTVKNASSIRKVPIHPRLIEWGFLEYFDRIHREGHERLWPDLERSKTGRYGDNVTKWFKRHMVQCGAETGKGALHRLRHSWSQECRRAGIRWDAHKVLGGWGTGEVGEAYGNYTQPELAEYIAKLEFPGLNLDHLKR